MIKNKTYTFEEKYEEISKEVEKWRPMWRLSSLPKINFDDIKVQILVRVSNKFDQWDQKRPLKPWLYRVIKNDFDNKLRDEYYNFAKPCLSCAAYIGATYKDGEGQCSIYGLCSCDCKLYKKWYKKKRYKEQIELATSINAEESEGISNNYEISDVPIDYEKYIKSFNTILKARLNKKDYQIYLWLFIENKDESWVAEQLGYKTSEKNRQRGYRQIKNIKDRIRVRAEKIISEYSLEDLNP